jgi:hypothetical protein
MKFAQLRARGMGKVYLAFDTELDRSLMVKFLWHLGSLRSDLQFDDFVRRIGMP